jgi:hypothetical protein
MKKSRLIQRVVFLSLGIVFVFGAMNASVQAATAPGPVEAEAEKYMPLLKGDQWLKMDPNSKVAFIWGAAHVILIELILMEEFPQLKVENFSAKVHEARTARQKAGTPLSKMTINEIISQIDQYYKDNPGKRDVSVMRVIWDVGIKPHVKSNIAGRPLK